MNLCNCSHLAIPRFDFVIPRLDRGIHNALREFARETRLDSGFRHNDERAGELKSFLFRNCSHLVIPRLDRGIHNALRALARITRLDSGFRHNDERVVTNLFSKTKTIKGPVGLLEVVTTLPKAGHHKGVGIICHPDPRQQGTMNNKVVTTIARAFDHLGLATVRFNFRGVGQSAGEYGQTIGESEDLLAIINWVKEVKPEHDIWLSGFSFGAYIAANIANQTEGVKRLLSIAPPVHHYDFQNMTTIHCPWLVIQGDQDEVVPFDQVKQWALHPPSPLEFKVIEGVGHFFHGHLIELRELLVIALT